MRNKGKTKRKIISTAGGVSFDRQHYICCKCNKHVYPADDMLELSRSMPSKRCAQSISLVASFVPFEHTKKVLCQLLMLDVSETCIEGVTHRVGTKLYHNAWIKGRQPYGLGEESNAPEQLYIQTDGGMVPICGDSKVEYKENKLGIVYRSSDISRKIDKKGEERVEIKRKRYVSSLGEGADKFKKMLYALSLEQGAKKAKEVIILGDGAVWISKFKEKYFPDAIQILDWFHAVEHLWDTARILFGEKNTKRCEEWVTPLKTLLWDGKIDTVIDKLTHEGLSRKTKQTAIFELRGYFISNREHMRYKTFRSKGYNIGSGAIESANKYIVGQRLKLAGMQWTISHANAMIHLRCKYFEDKWEEFWNSMELRDYLDHGLVEKYKAAA